MPEARTSIEIDAAPSRIWSVLTDLSSWPSWNTFVTSIEVQPQHHKLAVGSKQIIHICLDPNIPSSTESYSNTVTEIVPEQKFTWQGSFGGSMIINVEHWCTLEPVDVPKGSSPRTVFSQGERFSGLLAPIIGLTSKVQQLEGDYDRMNRDLKGRVGHAKIVDGIDHTLT